MAVDRALSILDAFAETDPKLSLAEIAKRTRPLQEHGPALIKSLEKFGYMHRSDDGAYQLGSKALFLGSLYQRHFSYTRMSSPPSCARSSTRSTRAHRSMCATATTASCLHRIDSTHAVRYAVHEGDRLPLSVGASESRHPARSTAPPARATSRFVATCTPRRTANAIRKLRRSHAPSSALAQKFVGALTISGAEIRIESLGLERILPVLFRHCHRLDAHSGRRHRRPLASRDAQAQLRKQ